MILKHSFHVVGLKSAGSMRPFGSIIHSSLGSMAPVATVEEVKVGDDLHIIKPMKFKVSVAWQQVRFPEIKVSVIFP